MTGLPDQAACGVGSGRAGRLADSDLNGPLARPQHDGAGQDLRRRPKKPSLATAPPTTASASTASTTATSLPSATQVSSTTSGVAQAYARTRVLFIIQDLQIRVIDPTTGETPA
jgi:hypothetical protein